MSFSNIDPIAKRFIVENIKSVAQLDLLLLLRTNPQQSWSADELARELRLDSTWTLIQLKEMIQSRIITSVEAGRFQYKPGSPEVQQAITTVAQAYLINRVSVIELIYNPKQDAIREFADAFRLRKEPPNG